MSRIVNLFVNLACEELKFMYIIQAWICAELIQLTIISLQKITVYRTSSHVTMDSVLMKVISVMAIMTVEITVMKTDVVCDVRWV